tara:strand:+ start:134 stop:2140 length:2007 start_codon:yes stop_codon:yes gene_type:complete
MSGAEHLPSGPLVKGNPFTQIPIDHEHQILLVGREKVATPITSQIINESPGIHLIVGDPGSGRSSLLQCLSSSDSRHIGTVWAASDPTSRILVEALVGFTKAFTTPPTPQAAADQLIHHLNEKQGPLPLIAFDYNTPKSNELGTVIKEIIPIMRRMRAMVVFAVSSDQMIGWDSALHNSFDTIHILEPLNQEHVRHLIDTRMGTVSNETILTEPTQLTRLHSYTNGNPTALMRQLNRHLNYLRFPEKSPMPEFLSFEATSFTEGSSAITPAVSPYSATPQQIPLPEPSRPLFSTPPPQHEDEYDAWFSGAPLPVESPIQSPSPERYEPIVDSLILDDADSMESEVGWEDEVIHFASRGGLDDLEDDPLYLESEDEPVPLDPFAAWERGSDEPESTENNPSETVDSMPNIVESSQIQIIDDNEGIVPEPLHIEHLPVESPLPSRRGGIMGLAERSKETKARLDANLPPNPPTSEQMGIEPLPIPKPIDLNAPDTQIPSFVESFVESEINSLTNLKPDPMTTRPPDLTSEGADLWVGSGINPSESHLPPPPINQEVPPMPPSAPIVSPEKVVQGLNALRTPRWDPDEPIRPERLRDVTDADVIVLTAAATRDISPSDTALQARLQVGRSRLSQIFNDLRRHGFLCVRKEGRTRWYRMTAAASRLLTEVEV